MSVNREWWRQRLRRSPRAFRWLRLANRLSSPFFSANLLRVLRGYLSFAGDWMDFHTHAEAENLDWLDLYPCVLDKYSIHPMDKSYFYQDTWAARKIFENRPPLHLDVGSTILFVGIISQFTRTISIDLRSLSVDLPGLLPIQGSILDLPLVDRSMVSVSSLCVIEHIGLGRYGDLINPQGTRQAAEELSRVLAPGGHLYISVPTEAKDRVHFNAHRAFSIASVCNMFPGLELRDGGFIQGDRFLPSQRDVQVGETAPSTVGLFHFVRA